MTHQNFQAVWVQEHKNLLLIFFKNFKNDVTYLRLKDCGHDLDQTEVHEMAYHWLASMLLGQKCSQHHLIDPLVSSENSPYFSDYIFSRGKKDKGESHGEVYGDVRGEKDSNGNQRYSGEVGARHDFGNGWSVEGNAGGSQSTDRRGNVQGEVHVGARGGYTY